MSNPHAYQFSFRVGIIGTLLLCLYTVFGNTFAGLSALAVWCIMTLFLLPWVYVFYTDKVGDIPYWAIRGPHQ